jgi:hypothetical protein
MSSSQGAAGGSKNIKSAPRERRRGSFVMILLGIALLIGALLLYFYQKSNRPKVMRSDDIRIKRTQPATENPRPTPSPTALPSKNLAPKNGL